MTKIISLNTRTASCRIYAGKNAASGLTENVRSLDIGNYCILVTQKNIISRHKKNLSGFFKEYPHSILTVPDGEKAKTRTVLFSLLENILKKNTLTRKIFIANLGGGAVSDIGGFAASVYKRGIPYINIPTTLLAQVDAAIGGKTALNLSAAKNIVGAFYQPQAVFIDPLFLTTLAQPQIRQGFAEIIKYAAIRDKAMYELLRRASEKIQALDPGLTARIIERCVRIKADIVSRDEKETKGLRTLLNFGHTVGHALESSCKYKKQISHGEAVALGMIVAGHLSFNLGVCPGSVVEDLYQLIRLYGLPVSFTFDRKKALSSLMHDKKFISGSARMVLLERLGKAVVYEKTPLKSIKNALKYIHA